jgi:hypothetical protein
MTQLPYVLIVLFSLNNGAVGIMDTSQTFASPMSCSMRAFIENETVDDRTYVCVTRDRAASLMGKTVDLAQK